MSAEDAMIEINPFTYEKINADKPIINIFEFQNKTLSNESYKLITLYFENNTKNWIRITSARIVNIPDVKEYQVVVGDDLTTLRKSLAIELKLNKNELQSYLKVPKEKRSEEVLIQIKKLQMLPDVAALEMYKEEDHLHSKISIPAGLKTRRWFVIFLKDSERMTQFDIEVILLDGTRKVFRSEVMK